MAYFHCLIGGGSSGGGYELTVTCDADFAGTTITATDGVTTLTKTCPSASPYEVVFEIPNGGTWTVSGIVGGSTCTASIDIPDELELVAIPDGSTVTPTDVIQTWLRCGGIFDKSYTTLNEVLADSTTLLALMSDNNAVDYLVRSTTWASGITADSTAMTDIGANNYCADILLADSTWAAAICNSTYFENVLNAKVPTMTSNTTPSGLAVASSEYSSTYAAWKAFDNNNTTYWNNNGSTAVGTTIGYYFTTSVLIKKLVFKIFFSGGDLGAFKLQGSDDGNTWYDVATQETAPGVEDFTFLSGTNTTFYSKWRIYVTSVGGGNRQNVALYSLQFYGRADV